MNNCLCAFLLDVTIGDFIDKRKQDYDVIVIVSGMGGWVSIGPEMKQKPLRTVALVAVTSLLTIARSLFFCFPPRAHSLLINVPCIDWYCR